MTLGWRIRFAAAVVNGCDETGRADVRWHVGSSGLGVGITLLVEGVVGLVPSVRTVACAAVLW